MNKYTRFPEEKYYIQSSPEIHELVMAFADKHGISVLDISRREGYNERDPFLCFSNDSKCICRAGRGYRCSHKLITLSEWIAMFKEPEPSKEDTTKDSIILFIEQTEEALKNLRKQLSK